MYRGLLKLYAPQYKVILEHLRDRPGEGILWHCTAGKDRAGLFAMLILSLAGADKEVVGFDYSLSRIGVEEGRPVLMKNLIKWLGEDAVVSFPFLSLWQTDRVVDYVC
jgi:protein tyrosine/serine phosphatase